MCYYYRKFNNLPDQVRFGGTFIFDNLTSGEFYSDDLILKISIDGGNSWLDCKKQRQIFREEYDKDGDLIALIYDGVLADVKETENKQLVLTFGLNESYFEANADHVPVTGPSVDSNAGIVICLRNE
jgi:hypothetical protein